MPLRDTTWIADTTAIQTDFQVSPESRVITFFATSKTYTRTLKRYRRVWVCLTRAAAVAYATAHAADTGHNYQAVEDNRQLGAFSLIDDIDSTTNWVSV